MIDDLRASVEPRSSGTSPPTRRRSPSSPRASVEPTSLGRALPTRWRSTPSPRASVEPTSSGTIPPTSRRSPSSTRASVEPEDGRRTRARPPMRRHRSGRRPHRPGRLQRRQRLSTASPAPLSVGVALLPRPSEETMPLASSRGSRGGGVTDMFYLFGPPQVGRCHRAYIPFGMLRAVLELEVPKAA